MATVHNLGFPRLGRNRELKFALERYWKTKIDAAELEGTAKQLRADHWKLQAEAGVDIVPVGDASFYDHVLDASFMLGNVPQRFHDGQDLPELDQYFRVARGRSVRGEPRAAGAMTKWFDTNYHYIVPEFDDATTFSANPSRLLEHLSEVQAAGYRGKPVMVGPLSYLWLGRGRTDDKLALLPALLTAYRGVLDALAKAGAEWVQLDEPILALDLDPEWRDSFTKAYQQLNGADVHIMVASYFAPLQDNLATALALPVAGLHLDLVRGRADLEPAVQQLPADKVLSLGVIDGRNIWKSDLGAILDLLEPVHATLGERLWLAPSCSLLHVPFGLQDETAMDAELLAWLAFAGEKLAELHVLATALQQGRQAVAGELADNAAARAARAASPRVTNPAVQKRVAAVTAQMAKRPAVYAQRAEVQREALGLPLYPTTTIGSFPQTAEIRKIRREFKKGAIDNTAYEAGIREQIAIAIKEQEAYGLDVLVHGEAERNDMVEYFGEQLQGYAFTQNGWVQSYGSRGVKPPIIFGDVSRPEPMTVTWTTYAQSLTKKPMKGMLTGPVTMLQWAFVRDDQPRETTTRQIALALRDEVVDLEQAGIHIIQVDEPAFREGLPLRRADWPAYLSWATETFRLATSGVQNATQIHTHMCYSEFNNIIESVADLDADVITMETSRSNMELLEAFTEFKYPNEIGPGVYDIHSPNIPDVEQMTRLMRRAAQLVPAQRLWVNPDCGLKTRGWDEVRPSLQNMVAAAKILRKEDS